MNDSTDPSNDVNMDVARTNEPSNSSDNPENTKSQIYQTLYLIRRFIISREKRFFIKAVKSSNKLRKALSAELLKQVLQSVLPPDYSTLKNYLEPLAQYLSTSDQIPSTPQPSALFFEDFINKEVLYGVELYLGWLELLFLLDNNQISLGEKLGTFLVERFNALNVRILDSLGAKIYFYYSRFYELANNYYGIKNGLFSFYRSSIVHNDVDCEAVLINLILRNYIHYNLYDQAEKLISKTNFPVQADNNQISRYMYYLGRINAVLLNYSKSHDNLLQALRKAPQGSLAIGFSQTVNKLAVIVQLLMGKIPARSLFYQKHLAQSLLPYFHITQAVRKGNLNLFQDTLSKFIHVFQKDKNFTLILRLRHNVIKAGIRLINLTYSRISISDICKKLKLESVEDSKYIVIKTISDGVIDAVVDSDKGFIQSKDIADVYSTYEPQKAFFERINFCLTLRDDALQAMRYPESLNKKDWRSTKIGRAHV